MIEILRFDKRVTKDSVGNIIVRYHDILMRCEIVIYRKKKLWIRMPEKWINGFKFPYVKWLSNEISSEFQKLMIKKLFDKYNFDLDAALDLLSTKKKFKPKRKTYTEKANLRSG